MLARAMLAHAHGVPGIVTSSRRVERHSGESEGRCDEMAATSTTSAPATGARANVAAATLTINSRNYGAWSLRGWLLCRFSGLDVDVEVLPADDPSVRAELTLLSSSFLVPRLTHEGVEVWDTLAIAEYLYELAPESGLLPTDRAARAHCRAVSGEMHSGFANLRSSLPMNVKSRHSGYPVWAGAQADIDRITEIWTTCLDAYGGPYLFGATPTVADAMYAPVCTRFVTYDVPLDEVCRTYRDTILAMPAMREWIDLAAREPDEIEELDVEF
jgi:glutathione S-transferase